MASQISIDNKEGNFSIIFHSSASILRGLEGGREEGRVGIGGCIGGGGGKEKSNQRHPFQKKRHSHTALDIPKLALVNPFSLSHTHTQQ